MYELSVALKYLTPRWKQISVSIISLISILVISLVVWLIVVFFSVSQGLENAWTQKLIALTAPVRITPTEDYYHSYYYQIDSISAASNYNPKSIGEKLASATSDPHDPTMDEQIPEHWPQAVRDQSGALIDPVKTAFSVIEHIPGASASDYEMTFSNIRLRLVRPIANYGIEPLHNQSFISQSAYLTTLDGDNPMLEKALLKFTPEDASNLLAMSSVGSENIQEDQPDSVLQKSSEAAQLKLKNLFAYLSVERLKPPEQGWALPLHLLPSECTFQGCAEFSQGQLQKLIITEAAVASNHTQPVTIKIKGGQLYVSAPGIGERPVKSSIPLIAPPPLTLDAVLQQDSLLTSKKAEGLIFEVSGQLQTVPIKGRTVLGQLQVDAATLRDFNGNSEPLWVYRDTTGRYRLPSDPEIGESVLLPRTFKDAGVLIADRGYLSYHSPTASSVQEQRIPIVVAGFYDPGIIPMGGKFILANREVASLIRSSHNQEDTTLGSGINVRLNDLASADKVKQTLIDSFNKHGIGNYWKVETYREYDFTRDILQQLRSEKNLFSLISLVIIVVACSNIISMLIILVNDKKQEIGILRSMGATSSSIALIFGTCGVIMGLAGSFFGILMAVLTLHYLDDLVALISRLQGFELFNPLFYGEQLPAELSLEALGFVMIMTACISMAAGIVPAMKACLMKPSAILREE